MPLADPRNIGREQAYGQSPSGPGPYAPSVRRLPPDLQPYAGPQPAIDMGYHVSSPSGPRGASMQPQQSPTSWMDQLQAMLRNATTGLDPARTGLQGMFGQQQPRSIQTTDPGAGYGMSPSGPTARLGSAQFPDTPSDAPRAGTWMHGNVQRPKGQGVIEQFSVPANYGQSPSNPNWQPRPKPMSPFYEPPRPPVGGP
jgi:hypothetical protein